MKQSISVVIGKNFGDEGKGLATDYLCRGPGEVLNIRHNGGAQSGHTVETEDGKRFIFHQLGAGSFRHSRTFWADTYYPDLYKLKDELDGFISAAGFAPGISCDRATCTVLPCDVLVNMALETMRGDKRHGSCGMGINEADLRIKAGYGITIREFLADDAAVLQDKLRRIRDEYLVKRLKETGLADEDNEYTAMLRSDDVIANMLEVMMRNARFVNVVDDTERLIRSYENIVFETGQGLLLDGECERFMPHVSASRTGLNNPVRFLKRYGLEPTDAVYVTRSYVTRHGAGPLPCTCGMGELGDLQYDETNVPNAWQGTIRYARHEGYREFVGPVLSDITQNGYNGRRTLFITHLNETDGMIRIQDGDVRADDFVQRDEIKEVFDTVLGSASRMSGDIYKIV